MFLTTNHYLKQQNNPLAAGPSTATLIPSEIPADHTAYALLQLNLACRCILKWYMCRKYQTRTHLEDLSVISCPASKLVSGRDKATNSASSATRKPLPGASLAMSKGLKDQGLFSPGPWRGGAQHNAANPASSMVMAAGSGSGAASAAWTSSTWAAGTAWVPGLRVGAEGSKSRSTGASCQTLHVCVFVLFTLYAWLHPLDNPKTNKSSSGLGSPMRPMS